MKYKWKGKNEYEKMYKKTLVGRYITYKHSAKVKHLEFELTKEQFISIVSKECSYCGTKENIGIDRIDNQIGYTIENSNPCCTMCNMMKRNIPKELFLEHCNKISLFNS